MSSSWLPFLTLLLRPTSPTGSAFKKRWFTGTAGDLAQREAELLAQGVSEKDLGPQLSTLVPLTNPPQTDPDPLRPEPTAPSTTEPPAPTLEPSRDGDVFDSRDPTFFDEEFLASDALSDGKLTVLLTGGDAGPGRSGLRTDVIMVAVLDLENGGAALFGLPRNSASVPLPSRVFRGLRGARVGVQRG